MGKRRQRRASAASAPPRRRDLKPLLKWRRRQRRLFVKARAFESWRHKRLAWSVLRWLRECSRFLREVGYGDWMEPISDWPDVPSSETELPLVSDEPSPTSSAPSESP